MASPVELQPILVRPASHAHTAIQSIGRRCLPLTLPVRTLKGADEATIYIGEVREGAACDITAVRRLQGLNPCAAAS